MGKTGSRPANRLVAEKSPYLLQHAYNPVDWHPWGAEAFQKAKSEGKLVFLSIGYSTCHWCHVMERESFEDEQVAALLNQHFVPVKVDREERPDIDHIYMTAVQALTGSGGWPLSVFLTPEGKPVTGGTYFPPEDRWGRPGMKTLLPRLAKLWSESRPEMEKAGEDLTGLLQEKSPGPAGQDLPSAEGLIAKAYQHFEQSFDPKHGGFGGAPKFPRSHEISLLLRYWKRTGEPRALEMAEFTLKSMALGGIYDHLGGGLHRYSTDERWLVPHFEKMLYDQAIIARTYIEAYQATGAEFYAGVARDILGYVLGEMTSSEGGFYSAEDADSEGEEGIFYVWRPEEVTRELGPHDGKIFNEFYGVDEAGNFESGASILHVTQSLEDFARSRGLTPESVKKILTEARPKLFKVRGKRIRPFKDDKILTAWNGLMITALAKASAALGDAAYAEAARKAAGFVLERMSHEGILLRRFRTGESAIPGFLEDYAMFASGLLDLYEATFEIRWIEEASRLCGRMIELFWDEQNGGFFSTPRGAETLIVRPKEYYDGAVPSGNSAAANLLLKLSRMAARPDYEKYAAKIFASNAAALSRHPVAHTEFLSTLDFAAGPGREILIAGNPQNDRFKRMNGILRQGFRPGDVLLHLDSGEGRSRLEALAPFVKAYPPAGGAGDEVRVYVCENHVCRGPVTREEDFRKEIGA